MSSRGISPFLVSICLIAGCGNPGETDSGTDTAMSPTEKADVLDPCTLLTAEQVATVFPGAKEGFVAHAGGSLVKGIDSYQCSYADSTIENAFLVIFHRAATDVLFEDIKPDVDDDENVDPVPVGDGGWLTRNERGVKLQASKGRLTLELTLRAPGATERAAELTQIGGVLIDELD